jgi:hypothetical protein
MTLRRSVQDTISVLRADVGAYDPEVLDALIRCHAVEAEYPSSEVAWRTDRRTTPVGAMSAGLFG